MPKIDMMPKTIEEIVLPTKANSDGSYTCCYCDAIVKRKYDLKRHVAGTHINARPYRCAREGAGCTFSGANQKGNLTQHYNTSPECEAARLKKEAEDAKLTQISSTVKVEETPQLHRFDHLIPRLTQVGDEPEIPASIRASVVKPKKIQRLGSHRATPYLTSCRRGPSASEASTSRPSRRQAQVTSDVASFYYQVAVPQPQPFSMYPVQQYQSLAIGNYEQVSQYGAWQSSDLGNASDLISQPACGVPQPSYPVTTQDYLLPEMSSTYLPTIDPAFLCMDNTLPEFDCASDSSSLPYFSFQDEALQKLFAAAQASGGIEHQAQVDPVLLLVGDDYTANATLSLCDPLDAFPLDTVGEYELFCMGWPTGDQSYLQPTLADDSALETAFEWMAYPEDLEQRNLATGYIQNPFSACPSPVSLMA